MKVKNITITYTTGKSETITPKPKETGFLVLGDEIRPTAAWSVDDAFKTVATLLLTAMSQSVNQFGTYKPLFDKLEETVGLVEQQLSPAQFAKDFAHKFLQGYLFQEVMHTDKYKELRADAEKFSKDAAKKLASEKPTN